MVALRNYQGPGINFSDTFDPVVRMSSFRMTFALAAELSLRGYGGDTNTAYFNSTLKIPNYVKTIDAFPCQQHRMYVVHKALYGLRQCGRECNDQLHR